jgi:allophanate hydrolase subunit 1
METQQIKVYLGVSQERAFVVEVTKRVFDGGWYSPTDIEYIVSPTIYDAETGEDCSELIERWENLYKEDFINLAVQEFQNNY